MGQQYDPRTEQLTGAPLTVTEAQVFLLLRLGGKVLGSQLAPSHCVLKSKDRTLLQEQQRLTM